MSMHTYTSKWASLIRIICFSCKKYNYTVGMFFIPGLLHLHFTTLHVYTKIAKTESNIYNIYICECKSAKGGSFSVDLLS